MSLTSAYTDPQALRADREAALALTLDLVFERHPHYREVLHGAGLRREHLRSLEDLQRLPVTTKAQYMAHPQRFVLEGEGLPLEMRTVWDVMYTTGSTSGQPTPFVSTSYDFYNILQLQRQMLLLRGVERSDLIANLFPVTTTPHGAWIRVLHAAASLQVPVVCALPGNPSPWFELGQGLDEVVGLVAERRATILWGVPSYVQRVLVRAAELALSLESVRLVFVTGEALSEPARQQMQQALAAAGAARARISVSYGATEMQGGMVECTPGAGLHNPLPAQFLVDVVDPDTGQVLPEGEPGTVLLTHLNRRGTVLLRYALGDVSVLSRAPCPHCGVVTDRLVRMPRRSDALVKVKGMLVNPDALVEDLDARLGATPYLLVADSLGEALLAGDRLRLLVEQTEAPGLAQELALRVKQACGVTPLVVFESPGALQAQGGWKVRKFVDRRTPG